MLHCRPFAGVITVAAIASPATADTIVVGPNQSIQFALNAAQDGDEIIVLPSIHNEAIDFLGKEVTLRSAEGPEVTIITPPGSGSVVTCTSNEGPDTILDGFTITGGVSKQLGGGMLVLGNSDVTVRGCWFVGNVSPFGAGIYLGAGELTVDQCAFVNNTPRLASASICGVLACGCPSRQPTQSFRSSIAMSRTLGFSAANVEAAVSVPVNSARAVQNRSVMLDFMSAKTWVRVC